jgi:hypothetical protein
MSFSSIIFFFFSGLPQPLLSWPLLSRPQPTLYHSASDHA